MISRDQIEAILSKFKNLESFISSDLVELATGQSLCGISIIPDFDSLELCRLGAVSIRAINEGMDLINQPWLVSLQVTTPASTILVQALGKTLYIGLAIGDSKESDIAKSRLAEIAKELESVI